MMVKFVPNDQAQICEVEFELKQGSPQDLITFAHTWVKKYQLRLDVRSKAERAVILLAVTKRVSPATKAKTLKLNLILALRSSNQTNCRKYVKSYFT